MIVRRELVSDQGRCRALHVAAFAKGDGEPVEAALLDGLRAGDDWLAPLSLVAEADDVVVGHNVCTRGWVGDVAGLGLGPIAVDPARQHSGVGSALMWAMIGAADALGEPFIALLGDPGYYHRFGFTPSSKLGIEPPEAQWGDFFQALPLSGWSTSTTGRFRYAASFDDLS